jgi:hypothetical protein
MPLQRLAPKTQKAYVTAVAGLAKFYQCSPDRLRPEQIRTYLHHLLVERHVGDEGGEAVDEHGTRWLRVHARISLMAVSSSRAVLGIRTCTPSRTIHRPSAMTWRTSAAVAA